MDDIIKILLEKDLVALAFSGFKDQYEMVS